ncbi:MAG: winged helix-turn-helix transcriptional regulator, partial [Thermoplasmatota archaeon]
SLVMPSEMRSIELTMYHAYLDIKEKVELTEEMIETFGEMGYSITAIDPFQTGAPQGYEMVSGNLTFTLGLSISRQPDFPRTISRIDVLGRNISLEDEGRDDVMGFLEVLDLNVSFWDEAVLSSDPITEMVPVPVSDPVTDTFDWGGAMEAELSLLVYLSVISGLQPHDIEMIGRSSGPGAAGPDHRLIFHEGSWVRFSSVFDINVSGPTTDRPNKFFLPSSLLPDPANQTGSENGPPPILYGLLLLLPFIILPALAFFGYSRLRRKALTENLNRKRIMEVIRESPGIHFQKIMRVTGLKQGVLSYHVNILEKENYIKSTQDGIKRRFYLFDEMMDTNIFLSNLQEMILSIVNDNPGITQAKISKRVGKNRAVINYHIKILRDVGYLNLSKSGRESHCFLSIKGGNALTD